MKSTFVFDSSKLSHLGFTIPTYDLQDVLIENCQKKMAVELKWCTFDPNVVKAKMRSRGGRFFEEL